MSSPERTMTLTIRERRPDELPIDIEIRNAARLPEWHNSLEEAQGWESLNRPEDKVFRLLALEDGQAVGTAGAFHGVFHPPGRFEVDVSVRPEYQRRGIGTALYEQLVTYAADNGARELECEVRETELPKIARWLEREGFREVSRMRPSELDLTRFDFALHGKAIERASACGIRFTTLAEEDSDKNRHKLWELTTLTVRDIPFDVPHPDEPFDRFQDQIDAPHCLRDCLVIAADDDRYVGCTVVGRKSPERVLTWTTGVHPDYRGRGLAFAMKVRSAQLVAERGYTIMRTFNHHNNPAMLAVNTRLGYVPLPELIFLVKTLAHGA
jgi:GNAT superfamily N-acetyltransferase